MRVEDKGLAGYSSNSFGRTAGVHCSGGTAEISAVAMPGAAGYNAPHRSVCVAAGVAAIGLVSHLPVLPAAQGFALKLTILCFITGYCLTRASSRASTWLYSGK